MEHKPDSIVSSIISQFMDRSRIGLEKYGTTLDRKDLSFLQWVQHAQEEHFDAILYLEKMKQVKQNETEEAPCACCDKCKNSINST
jgi:hypothetical protein